MLDPRRGRPDRRRPLTRRAGATIPEIAVQRKALLGHLELLEHDGQAIPCRSGGLLATVAWTSDEVDEQRAAARACGACPAVTACRQFGLAWPDLPGTYGGLPEAARRRPTRSRKANP